MITDQIPATPSELERAAAQILSECGFEVTVNAVLSANRFLIDGIYSEECVTGHCLKVLCEVGCWNNPAPLSTINSFSRRVADVGPDIGYIIWPDKNNSGQIPTIDDSRIRIRTWQEFQEEFEKQWYQLYFINRLSNVLDPLLECTAAFGPSWAMELSEKDKRRFLLLQEKHRDFGWLVIEFTRRGRQFNNDSIPRLPLIENRLMSRLVELVPSDIVNAANYRLLMDAVARYAGGAIDEFNALRQGTDR